MVKINQQPTVNNRRTGKGCFKLGCLTSVGVFAFFVVIAFIFGTPEADNVGTDEPSTEEVSTEEALTDDAGNGEADETEAMESDESPTVVEDREYSVGKANKDINELSSIRPRDVRNDHTESWKLSSVSDAVDITEYVLSYADEHIEDDDGVHWVVNYTYNTTTSIIDVGDHFLVYVYERVNREEHDASTLGSGMLLGDYAVYKDNGDIVDNNEIIADEQ